MKKRKILSALLAAAMTCAMCLSAGAADVSPCIYDLEKESTHKTVSAGSYSYDCYTTLYYGSASKGCLWAVEKNKKDAQAAANRADKIFLFFMIISLLSSFQSLIFEYSETIWILLYSSLI